MRLLLALVLSLFSIYTYADVNCGPGAGQLFFTRDVGSAVADHLAAIPQVPKSQIRTTKIINPYGNGDNYVRGCQFYDYVHACPLYHNTAVGEYGVNYGCQLSCPQPYQPSNDGTKCLDSDGCTPEKAMSGGICINRCVNTPFDPSTGFCRPAGECDPGQFSVNLKCFDKSSCPQGFNENSQNCYPPTCPFGDSSDPSCNTPPSCPPGTHGIYPDCVAIPDCSPGQHFDELAGFCVSVPSSSSSSASSSGGLGSSTSSSGGGDTGTSSSGSPGSSSGSISSSSGSVPCIGDHCTPVKNNGAASGNCQAPPTCSDPSSVECAQLKQSWIAMCQLNQYTTEVYVEPAEDGKESTRQLFEDFQTRVSSAPNIQALSNFLVFNRSGSCPVWSADAGIFQIQFDFFCSDMIPWGIISGVLMACSLLVAFRLVAK